MIKNISTNELTDRFSYHQGDFDYGDITDGKIIQNVLDSKKPEAGESVESEIDDSGVCYAEVETMCSEWLDVEIKQFS